MTQSAGAPESPKACPLPKPRSRKLNSRTGRSGQVKAVVGFLFLAVLGVSFAGWHILRADDSVIPGWALQRLGREAGSQSKMRTGGDAVGWMASVPEADWQYIILHHSASSSGSVESIHREHRQRKDASGNPWLGIGYHFVIGNGQGMDDGLIQPTFRWSDQVHGAHSGNALFNARGIGICLIGNFEQQAPTMAQMRAVRDLVKTLSLRHQISFNRIMGHGDVKATACPGKHFPLKELREFVSRQRSR